ETGLHVITIFIDESSSWPSGEYNFTIRVIDPILIVDEPIPFAYSFVSDIPIDFTNSEGTLTVDINSTDVVVLSISQQTLNLDSWWGYVELNFTITDVSGDQSYVYIPIYHILDVTEPDITLQSPSDGAVLSIATQVTVHVNDTYLENVEYTWDGGDITTCNSGFLTMMPSSEGSHLLSVEANDSAGNIASVTFTVTIDITKPSIHLPTVSNSSAIRSIDSIEIDIVDLHFDYATYSWNGGANNSLVGDSISPPGVEGAQTLEIYAVDVADNWESQRYVFTVDNTAPAVALLSPSNSSTVGYDYPIELLITDAVQVNTTLYSWDGTSNQTLPLGENVTTPYGYGEHTLDIYARDSAGNWVYTRYRFNVDCIGPSIALVSPSNESVHQSGELISISVGVDATETYYSWDGGANLTVLDPLPVGDGEHTLVVVAVDEYGNWNQLVVSFVTDDTAPDINLITPSQGSMINSGTEIILSFAGDPVIKYYSWDNFPNSTILSLAPSGDGDHTLDVWACDGAGNWNHTHYSFVIMDTPPDITLLSPLNGTTHQSGVEILISAGVDYIVFSWDGSVNVTEVSPLPEGEGIHILKVWGRDPIGNWNYKCFIFYTDDIAPTITLQTPENYATCKSGTEVVFEFDLDTEIILFSWNSDDNVTGPAYVPQGDGTHILEVWAADAAGNWNHSMYTFYADNTPPIITLESPTNTTIQRSSTQVVIVVTGNPIVTYYSWDGFVNTTSIDSIPSGDGLHSLEVWASDSSGNWDYMHYVFTTDDTPIMIIGITPTNGTVHQSGAIISVSFDETPSIQLYSWDMLANTTSMTPLPDGDGEHTLYIWVMDTIGNWNNSHYIFTADNTPIMITGITPTNGTVHQSDEIILVTFNEAPAIQLYSWDMLANTTTPGSLPAGDGEHILYVWVTDSTDNWNHVHYVFTTDDTPIMITGLTPINGTVHQSGENISVTFNEEPSIQLYSWDMLTNSTTPGSLPAGDGVHTFYIWVMDAIGNWNHEYYIFFADDTGPNVEIDGLSFVESETMNITITAIDTAGVVRIEVWIDSIFIANITSNFVELAIDSRLYPNGEHVLIARAIDVCGNSAYSDFDFIINNVEIITTTETTPTDTSDISDTLDTSTTLEPPDSNPLTMELIWVGSGMSLITVLVLVALRKKKN
ncbi:MAG: Ig-like domain-containing protein, partial [Candidatus Thorarchaeota archaeon]